MSTVINFSAYRNNLRAEAQAAEREAAKAARREKERQSLAEALGGTIGAQIVADVVTDLREREQATRPVPAYCDPSNEVRGSKYEATRNLSPREVTARIRQDIKAAQKRGEIRDDVKTSVRLHSYSGGWSVDVRVTALPVDFRITSAAYASWVKQFGPHKLAPMAHTDTRSPEYRDLVDRLEAIRAAYNRDNSDAMTDYFDVRYYGSTSIDWTIAHALEAAEIEASAGDYWHESAGR